MLVQPTLRPRYAESGQPLHAASKERPNRAPDPSAAMKNDLHVALKGRPNIAQGRASDSERRPGCAPEIIGSPVRAI